MSNIISLHNRHGSDHQRLVMSNGLTAVFISVLTLAASALAKRLREKELTVWLAEKDQTVVGSGSVGFSIDEMPWTQIGFAGEKQFLLNATEAARNRTGWQRLDYDPAEMIFERLDTFRDLINAFDHREIDPANYTNWINAPPEYQTPSGFPKCSAHQVLLHRHGCVICNDAPTTLDGTW